MFEGGGEGEAVLGVESSIAKGWGVVGDFAVAIASDVDEADKSGGLGVEMGDGEDGEVLSDKDVITGTVEDGEVALDDVVRFEEVLRERIGDVAFVVFELDEKFP